MTSGGALPVQSTALQTKRAPLSDIGEVARDEKINDEEPWG